MSLPIGMLNPHRVIAFVIATPSDLISLAAIASVFSHPAIDGKAAYTVKLLSMDSMHEVRSKEGLTLAACTPYAEYAGPIDTLVIFGAENTLAGPTADFVEWVRRRASHVQRIVSVGVGVFVLAPCGFLDGKRVTTHWRHSSRLARLYPQILVEKDQIFIKDGRIYSTAGASAGIDLALAIVEEDWGHQAATVIAHELVLYVRRPGGEPQDSKLLARQESVAGTPMQELPAWVHRHLTRRLSVNELAAVVGMSPRTFRRQFETHFRCTPARWIQTLRIEAACTHLSAGDAPLKVIARLAGLRDEQTLRRAFIQKHNMSPSEYREHHGSLKYRKPRLAASAGIVAAINNQCEVA